MSNAANFVNEHISTSDVIKYNIEEIDKSYVIGGTSARDWTIDRDRDIYLRQVANGREENLGRSTWTFYWKGDLIRVDTLILSTSGGPGLPSSSHKRIRNIDIPFHLFDQRAEIMLDLREALLAYRDGGIYAKSSSYSLTLD